MNRNVFLIVPILALLLLSCEKKQDIEAELSYTNIGSLEVSINNSKGTKMQGVPVKLGLFDTQETNSDGNVLFNDISEGYYTILIDKVEVEGVDYKVAKRLYIDGGVDVKEVIIPDDYVGDIEVIASALNGMGEVESAMNKTIYLVKEDDVKHIDLSLDNIENYAISKVDTDSKGMAMFQNVPSSFTYRCCYDNSMGYLVLGSPFSFLKADIAEVNVLIN